MITTPNGVKCIGYTDLNSRLASTSSSLYANNQQKWIAAAGPTTTKEKGVFALDPKAVKALVEETSAASTKFGGLVAAMLAKNPVVRPAAQDVEQALATGAPLVPGGAAIIEEDEEDEAIAAATEQRRAAEAKAAEERAVGRPRRVL